jgi:hypothetical protein
MATMLFGIDGSKLQVFQNLINKAFALFYTNLILRYIFKKTLVDKSSIKFSDESAH